MDSRMKKIGVIIPIYNTEKYLRQCIESVICQNYDNLSVILVNDCSPDNCLGICNLYAQKYPYIYIVNKEKNEGLSKARFSGVKIAKQIGCDFVCHVDSDDWLEKDAIKNLVVAQKETNADIVEAGYYRRYGLIKKKGVSTLPEFQNGIISCIESPKLFDEYFISFFGINRLGVNMWAKLYRIDLYNEDIVTACDYKMGEDLITNMKILPHVKKYCFINKPIYNYRYGGMTTKYNPHLWSDLKRMYSEKLSFAESLGYAKAYIPASIELKNILMSTIAMRLDFGHGSENIKADLKKEFYDDIWKSFDGYIGSYANERNDKELLSVISKDIDSIMTMAATRNRTIRARCKKVIMRLVKLFSSNH